MNEQLTPRQRRREFLITLAYTIFSLLMIIVTTIEMWPIWYVLVIATGLGFVWWSYTTKFRTYVLRAFVLTGFMCLQIFLYGIQAEEFMALIPTLCVQFLLISLYELVRALNIAVVETIVLFIYQAVFNNGFIIPEGHLERNRMILQALSFIVIIVLCFYIVRKHMQEEKEMEQLEEQLAIEKKNKNNFMANTSHELRTPINTVSGMCEILMQKNLPDELHNDVLDIQMTGAELHNIVTDILDYTALEAGTMELSPRTYSITSTLNDVMNMTMYENRVGDLELIFDCDPNIPRLLEGDEHQLRRIMKNLISNAIKFTSEGSVTVQVSSRPEEYGVNLIVSVKDTGIGIDIEDQEAILQGFYQVDSGRSRRTSGLGLGLSISSTLIRRMGGFLTIKSQRGKGSEFSFAVPQRVVDREPCISLLHPGSIRLVWYYKPKSQVESTRESFINHIRHVSDYLGVLSYQTSSLAECKHRVANGKGVNLVLGSSEYMEDKEYFDKLSEEIPVIVVTDRRQMLEMAPSIHVLHKPYNAMMLAEILNGGEAQPVMERKLPKRFTAPTAKILVVDDNLMNLKVVEGLLRKYKVKIVATTSGEEALNLIDSQDYDFVFMDHMMPGMDGVECFHHIRGKQGAYFETVPIIALTANAIAESREMFLAEGFNDFVAKPVGDARMNEVLQQFIPGEKQIFEDSKEYSEKEISERSESQISEKSDRPAAESSEEKTSASKKAYKGSAEAEKPEKVDPFVTVSGIDKETALMYCGDEDGFIELSEAYCQAGQGYEKDIIDAYDSKDLDKYALTAHTVKSSSKTLGIMPLSEIAFTQEMAAKAGDQTTIDENHEEFLRMFQTSLKQLRACLNDGEENDGEASVDDKSKEIEDWEALKAGLTESLETFESKAFEEQLMKVKGKTLNGKPLEEVLSGVAQKVADFDFEGAISELDDIGGMA